MFPNFSYVRAHSLEEAIQHLSEKDARLHAGGTDLLTCLRDDIFGASTLVSITKLKQLHGISETPDGGLRIGALTTISEVANSSIIGQRYPGLARGAAEVGSPQLRNQGTIGGNMCQKPRCWYYRGDFHCLRKGGEMCFALGGENYFHCIFGSDNTCCIVHPSDTAPPLVALDAQVKIVGPEGNRVVPAGKFHVLPEENVEKETVLQPGEIVTEIILPPPVPDMRSSYRKVRARRSWDFALAGVALALVIKNNKVERPRVVLSGAAPIPWRSQEVEEVIAGRSLNSAIVEQAAEAVVKNAQPLQHNEYKVPLFKAVIREELSAIANG
ncbi:MAG TPA: xanthine dehydrogenase family protein subunit M [Desulfomonilaceae bacterium]|nr:xanthine dehydrogenase family protein subunit M [Desulfomonilaceae bacterium]